MYLITHFYNEAFLLPFWIEHHLPLFDHAVLIDYGSTDNSVDIIKRMAPHWEVRPSCNQYFIEPDIGKEVMLIEEEFDGWKMALNITEFILHPDLRSYCKELDDLGRKGIMTTGVIMVDRLEERSEYDLDYPLVTQKTFGYFERDVIENPSTTGIAACSRSRLLHNHANGAYSYGRHTNYWTDRQDPELFLCWFGWAPFDYVKERKMQIQHKVSDRQKRLKDWSAIYCIDEQKIEEMYVLEHQRSYDLLEDEIYKKCYERYSSRT